MSGFPQLTSFFRTAPFSGPGAEDQYPPDQQIEPVHMDIDLKVDVTGRAASGVVTITATARAAGADRLTLDAVSFLDVVVKDPDGHELSWRHDGEKINLRWAKPLRHHLHLPLWV
jgi:aminopeptidase N